MADVVPLIDLDAAPRPESGAEPRPRISAPRPVRILAVLAAVLLTLVSAVPPARTMRPVLAAGGTAAAAFTLGPDALYTAAFGQNPDSESGVRGYSLPGGEQVWATSLPQNVQNLTLDAGVLLARSGSSPRMSFLDAATGKVLWQIDRPGTAVVTLSGGRTLLRADTGDGGTELRMVVTRTGATVWRRTLTGVGEILDDDVFTEDPDRVVVLGVDGHVTTLQFADGSVLGEGDLGVRLPGESDESVNGFLGVTVSADQLYVSRRENGRASLNAYGLPELNRLWRTEGGPTGFVHDCGPVLCIADTRWVSALDPSDGSVRWSDPAWSTAAPYGDGTLVAYGQQETPEAVVLDARTGQVRRRLGTSYTVGGLDLRADSRIAGRTWVSVTGPGDSAPHIVGSLQTEAPYGCSANGPYLACPTTAGPTTVWRIP